MPVFLATYRYRYIIAAVAVVCTISRTFLVTGNPLCVSTDWCPVVAGRRTLSALLSTASGWVQRFTCVAAKHFVADHQASLLAWSSVGVAYLRVLGSSLSPGLSAWALQAATKRDPPTSHLVYWR